MDRVNIISDCHLCGRYSQEWGECWELDCKPTPQTGILPDCPLKDEDYLPLRFANYCLELEILTPTRKDYENFLKQGPEYYDKHVENAEMEARNDR